VEWIGRSAGEGGRDTAPGKWEEEGGGKQTLWEFSGSGTWNTPPPPSRDDDQRATFRGGSQEKGQRPGGACVEKKKKKKNSFPGSAVCGFGCPPLLSGKEKTKGKKQSDCDFFVKDCGEDAKKEKIRAQMGGKRVRILNTGPGGGGAFRPFGQSARGGPGPGILFFLRYKKFPPVPNNSLLYRHGLFFLICFANWKKPASAWIWEFIGVRPPKKRLVPKWLTGGTDTPKKKGKKKNGVGKKFPAGGSGPRALE